MSIAVGEVRRENGPRQLVVCSDCGGLYEASPRSLREQRQLGKLPRCGHCRRPSQIDVTNSELLYWAERLTLDEIVDIAEMIWGPRQRWPQWQAIHLNGHEPVEPEIRVRLRFTRVTLHVRVEEQQAPQLRSVA